MLPNVGFCIPLRWTCRLACSNALFYQVHAVHDTVAAVVDGLLDAVTGMPLGQQQTCSRCGKWSSSSPLLGWADAWRACPDTEQCRQAARVLRQWTCWKSKAPHLLASLTHVLLSCAAQQLCRRCNIRLHVPLCILCAAALRDVRLGAWRTAALAAANGRDSRR